MSRTSAKTPAEIAITVSVVGGIITLARLLAKRDLNSPEVRLALADLRADEDLAHVLAFDNYLSHEAAS
jgi:hypothetical protein